MGMYTELVLSTRLQDDPDMIAVLRWMLSEGEKPEKLPSHDLFTKDRASHMLRCTSSYFAGNSIHALDYDDNSEYWSFIVRCDLKNYEGEIEAFIDWITPYLDVSGDTMIGYKRYEEDREPTIIYSPEYDSV